MRMTHRRGLRGGECITILEEGVLLYRNDSYAWAEGRRVSYDIEMTHRRGLRGGECLTISK